MKSEYSTKDIYFGRMTFNTGKEGYYKTKIQTFCKQDDQYLTVDYKINDRHLLLNKFVPDTKTYLTVSELHPMVEEFGDKPIPEVVTTDIIKLYLLRYRVKEMFKKTYVSDYQKTK